MKSTESELFRAYRELSEPYTDFLVVLCTKFITANVLFKLGRRGKLQAVETPYINVKRDDKNFDTF